MSRWKPPQPKSAAYITEQGFRSLETELRTLWLKRNEVTQALAAAAAEGDRSENAEYIYRKKELRGIDRRILYLQRRLPSLRVVSATPNDKERVYFGAWVSLENANGDLLTFRIVGADEIDPHRSYISLDSPLAKALMKKTHDDEVSITVNGLQYKYLILDIRYE